MLRLRAHPYSVKCPDSRAKKSGSVRRIHHPSRCSAAGRSLFASKTASAEIALNATYASRRNRAPWRRHARSRDCSDRTCPALRRLAGFGGAKRPAVRPCAAPQGVSRGCGSRMSLTNRESSAYPGATVGYILFFFVAFFFVAFFFFLAITTTSKKGNGNPTTPQRASSHAVPAGRSRVCSRPAPPS